MPDPIDPFNQAYTSLFTNIASDPYLKSMFKRMWDLSDPKFTQFPSEVSSNDLPELAMFPTSSLLSPLAGNSKESLAVVSYTIICTFDTLQVTNPLKTLWFLFRSFQRAGDTLYDLNFVRDVKINSSMTDPFGKEPWSRSSQRQVLTITVTPTFSIPTVKLLAFPTGF